MDIKINFTDSANRGSFAISAIATTLGGNWSGKSSTDASGIVTDVDSDIREWAEDILASDRNVESYTISEV